MKRFVFGLFGGSALAVLLLAPRPVQATLDTQKKAKAAGFDAANCLYCHNEKLPKKGAVTSNDRGKWLVAEKDKRKAKEIDITWLKEYTPPK
jgi:hypothetical protein